MKQFIAAFALAVVSMSSFASERIVDIDLFTNKFELSNKARDITIFNFDLRNEAKKVKYIEDDNCGAEEISCVERIVLEKEKVVQLILQYDLGPFTESYEYVEINFPLSAFSESDLEELQSLSGFWDFTGKKARARKKLAKSILNIDVKTVPKTINTIDYQNSTLCDIGDSPYWCTEDIRYVLKEIKVKNLSVTLK